MIKGKLLNRRQFRKRVKQLVALYDIKNGLTREEISKQYHKLNGIGA